MEAHPAHHGIRGEHPSFAFTSASDVSFALRTALAGIAALFTAMWLQLDTPRWAIWTVFIVSPPVRGNALRKTAARIVGTFFGCIVAIAFAALFPQDRIGFYFAFALWLGSCAYWATLRRGYVSYAASLAAFTSAIVSANVSGAPLDIWQNAMDRGSATVLGILFALFASSIAAGSDDVPGDFANRIRTLSADLLDWAATQLQPGKFNAPRDAPFTAQILGLNETWINAIAERPVLNRVKLWTCGIPTALLSLQSSVLGMRQAGIDGSFTHMLHGVADFLRSGASSDVSSLRRHFASLQHRRDAIPAQTSAQCDVLDALLYVLGALEAIITLNRPDGSPPLYPPPKFATHPRLAITNLFRAIVAIAVGFLIWNMTAWPHGPVFMVNIAVAMVVFVSLEDPVFANWANIVGTTVGGLIGLAAKYFILIGNNNPLNLVLVLFPLVFIGAWIETKGKLAPFGLFLVIGVLILIEPRNPQDYDFVHDVNTLIAVELAYGFVSLVFLAIGAPRKGIERITELLSRMRERAREATGASRRHQQLIWETQMYDELQRLQAATIDPSYRDRGVKLLLSGLRASSALN